MNRAFSEYVEDIRKRYPAGCRVKVIEMGDDPDPVPSGTGGTVDHVDDIGTVHCRFDNGRYLGLIPGEDRFEVMADRKTE